MTLKVLNMFTMLKGIKMFPTEYHGVFMIFREEYRGDILQPALGISGVENRAFSIGKKWLKIEDMPGTG